MPPKTKQECLIRLVIWVSLSIFTSAQTNLYSGYGKNKNQKDGLIDDIPTATLSNDHAFPLVGLGVGNLQANRIETMVYQGLQSDYRIRLIDTAHASRNEAQVAKGIVTGVQRFLKEQKDAGHHDQERVQVHLVTKVWYTHLGYERTKFSVRESLKALREAIEDPQVDLKVHMLLHWPRCYDGVEWMNCEQEEKDLPDEVKQLGYAPHLDKDNAWKQSWKALEDMYQSEDQEFSALGGIGVSNFGLDDMKALLEVARVKPHLTQINVWSLLNDPQLIELCNRNNVHVQVYNVMNGIISRIFNHPHAHHHLLSVTNELHAELAEKAEGNDRVPTIAPGQVILKWLIEFGISVIPRTSNMDRLAENSATAIAAVPTLTESHLHVVAPAVDAIMRGEDMGEDIFVEVTFHAKNQDMFLFFVAGKGKEQQIAFIPKGDSFEEKTHPHHKFRLYSANDPDVYHDYTVEGKYGDNKHVNVEL